MKSKINILLVSLILTISVFAYLSFHHYSVKTGTGGGDSICSLSSKLNCDASAASSYSEIAGIPIAVLGGVFHFMLLGFVLFLKLGWVDSSKQLLWTLRGQLLAAALVSVVMGLISVIAVKVACPFCIASYALSFLNLYLGWNIVDAQQKSKFEIASYFTEYKSHLYYLASIPLLAWAISGMAKQHYGLDQINRYVPEKIALWQSGTEYSLDPQIGISNKVENPRHTLVEFADFKCPHCKVASNTIKFFLKTRQDVKFVFKPFPLDGNCNAAISRKGDGSRCQLAAVSYCSEQFKQNGLEVAHWLFENQERLFDVVDIKTVLPDVQQKFGLDPAQMSECMDSALTYEQISKAAAEGATAQVEGTPTIYLNGKKLPWGHVLEVLRTAVNSQ